MGSFKFVNSCSSGAKVVQWIISNIGNLDINKVLIGSGCYVAGDSSAATTRLSTSCNGATLSDRLLEKLSSLSEQHGFVIAVDEKEQ
eukprot:15360529-Ditylum_brightwellii.AAC.1